MAGNAGYDNKIVENLRVCAPRSRISVLLKIVENF